ncbi:MAG: carbohydrate ABC transporter permease [Anaerolineae bacterium]|jgi:putative aldouronate transport system permease protein|nr:carbohydrate ABC transporter permease [Anaerolineae bacterium]
MATYSEKLRAQKRADTDQLMNLIGRFSIHLVLTILALCCLLPLLMILSASLTDEIALTRNGYTLLPAEFSTAAYELIFRNPTAILRAYAVTIFTTVVGTVIALMLMSPLAYVLSRPDFIFRKALSFYVFFTMLFNGGIVPYYILMTQYLRVQDTIFALLLPYLVVSFYVLILRTYFAGLPEELLDAARVDGASEFRIFISVALPLAKPALATIGLFTALNYWNDWTTALYFIRSAELYPLQYLLYIIQSNAQAMQLQSSVGMNMGDVPTQTARMAMAILATGPAAVFFLFFQRYLIRGVTLGAFK